MLGHLLPHRCAGCDSPGRPLCAGCAAGLPPAPDRPPPAGLDRCLALLAYRDPVPRLVLRTKNGGRHGALEPLGRAMGSMLLRTGDGAPWVTWAPTTPARRRRRGYDHARLLARGVARSRGSRVVPMLRRRGGAQAGRSREDRLAGPAFEPTRRLRGATVVLVDDVWTTGATLTAAAHALRAAGAGRVVGLVLAVRP
ncbi:MAG: ComF family protein [Microthrixaceae bacterium]